jgi:hypothetical protein
MTDPRTRRAPLRWRADALDGCGVTAPVGRAEAPRSLARGVE